MERKKVAAVHASKARDLTKHEIQPPSIFNREILHFVQDDRKYVGLMHVVMK
jgi:hypothetical protein